MKVYLILSIWFTSLLLSAQNTKPLTFGINGGIGISNMNDGDGHKAKMKFAYQAGVSVDIAFMPDIYLFTGAEFAVNGAKQDIVSEDVATNYDIEMQYIRVPLHFGGKFNIADSYTKLVFGIGPYLAYGIGGKTKVKTMGIESPGAIKTFGDDFLKPFDWGIGGRMGLEYGKMQFNIITNLGLADISKQMDAKQRVASAYLIFCYAF